MDERAALHARAARFLDAAAAGEPSPETFDALGVAIAQRQARAIPAYARLCAARGLDVARATRVAEFPAVPADAFRVARIAGHPPDLDRAVFHTSGTTAAPGVHALSTTDTYARGALAWGRHGLAPDGGRLRAIVLAPPPDEAPRSSLGFMIALFAQAFGVDPVWVVSGGEVDAEGLAHAAEAAARSGERAMVLGTSFAFVHALDALAGRALALPPGSRVMHTGGYKGRSREVAPDALRAAIAATFAVPEAHVVGEYGMTELSSQLYEGTLRAALGFSTPTARHGVFFPPPWLRVVPVDVDLLQPVAPGEVGLLRFEDLANVDAAVAVQTADRGRLVGGGVELLGRAPGATPRGCSIAMDELLSG